MEGEEFDSSMGLFKWVTRFLEDGADVCREGYRCRRANKGNCKRGSKKIKPSAGPGRWEPASFCAIENSRKKLPGVRVSISPLELATQALPLAAVGIIVGDVSEGRIGNGQIVMRCDNKSSCDVVNSRKPKSPAMRIAMRRLEEVEHAFGFKVRLEHIATVDNTVADALSHCTGAKRDVAIQTCEAILTAQGRVMTWLDEDSVIPLKAGAISFSAFALETERAVREAISKVDLEVLP